MEIIKTVDDLNKHKDLLLFYCKNNGTIWCHDFMYYETKLKQNVGKYSIFVHRELGIVCSLEEKTSSIWQSDINGSPIIFSTDVQVDVITNFLEEIIDYLGIKALYFQLVYENIHLYKEIKNNNKFKCWNRLQNPVIAGDMTYNELYKELKLRFKSRSTDSNRNKYKNKFTTPKLTIAEKINTLKFIESKSWKSNYKQDMLSRGQFDYYSKLLENNVLDFYCIYDDNIPVAYIIESFYKDIIYHIKWSYNEDYRKYAPGRNLLLDRLEFYDNIKNKYVDMYGGPDCLKDLFETGRIERFDFSYPNDRIIDDIRDERIFHDNRVLINYLNRKSIRHAYREEVKFGK